MMKNYARDFDERTIRGHIEEAEYKCLIAKQTILQLKKDLIFYYMAFIWFMALLWLGKTVFYLQLYILVMVTFMFLSKKLSFMNEKYFYYIGFMFCFYFLVIFLGGINIYFVLFIVFVCSAYIIFQTLRFVILTVPALKGVTAFFGRYNLGAIVRENQDKICRLKTELENRSHAAMAEDMQTQPE